MNIFFFGAGRLGRYWLEQWRSFGIELNGIFDNSESLWGTMCDGVMIYSPDMIREFEFDYIFITCRKEKEILSQLLDIGIAGNNIVSGYHSILNHMLYFATKKMILKDTMTGCFDRVADKRILLDLQNGMVLGGVEAWSYETAEKLNEKGYQGLYLTTDAGVHRIYDSTFPAYTMSYKNIEKEKDKIEICVKKIIDTLPCTIICNFPQYIFWSACIAKCLYPNLIKIVAIQHSDDIVYYEAYSLWKNAIDVCMTISSRMEYKLKLLGMKPEKLERLEWQIPCKKDLKRTWDEEEEKPLQIGYAGRITVTSKRIDLLFPLADSLKRRHVDFQINIVGTGDYSEILIQKIREENLQNCIVPMGYVERKNIPDFWSEQDIMVSCSEIEGHSISQSEAMAEGAVPVITDVSGARDDVADGYNGFIVKVGDIEALADRIQELYLDRDKLKQMGIRAHDTIYKRQKNMDQAAFWDKLIKKVWQE